MLAAARAGRVTRAFVAAGVESDSRIDELRSLVPVQSVDRGRLDRIAGGGVHQGVAAELAPRRFLSVRELLADSPRLLVALDGIQDPHNLGAILRTAEACGAEGAIIPDRRGAPLGPAAVKASSGASEVLPLCRVSGLAAALPEVSRAGLWCVALDPRGEQAAWEFDFRQPVCLVVGGEGTGLHRLVRERCDVGVRIPLHGSIESLNASAAAAALLYEVVRQRSAT